MWVLHNRAGGEEEEEEEEEENVMLTDNHRNCSSISISQNVAN